MDRNIVRHVSGFFIGALIANIVRHFCLSRAGGAHLDDWRGFVERQDIMCSHSPRRIRSRFVYFIHENLICKRWLMYLRQLERETRQLDSCDNFSLY